MVFESAEGLRVQEFEARVQSPRPGLRSLESRQDTPGNSQPEGELREANQQMREYLAELGHDLRTPLATICDALHVLTLDGDDGATREYVGDLMERQTQRIGLLIRRQITGEFFLQVVNSCIGVNPGQLLRRGRKLHFAGQIQQTPTIMVVSHGNRRAIAGVPDFNLLKAYLDQLLAK